MNEKFRDDIKLQSPIPYLRACSLAFDDKFRIWLRNEGKARVFTHLCVYLPCVALKWNFRQNYSGLNVTACNCYLLCAYGLNLNHRLWCGIRTYVPKRTCEINRKLRLVACHSSGRSVEPVHLEKNRVASLWRIGIHHAFILASISTIRFCIYLPNKLSFITYNNITYFRFSTACYSFCLSESL